MHKKLIAPNEFNSPIVTKAGKYSWKRKLVYLTGAILVAAATRNKKNLLRVAYDNLRSRLGHSNEIKFQDLFSDELDRFGLLDKIEVSRNIFHLFRNNSSEKILAEVFKMNLEDDWETEMLVALQKQGLKRGSIEKVIALINKITGSFKKDDDDDWPLGT
jgi:hypothetical protein